jgi:hypothetical protein
MAIVAVIAAMAFVGGIMRAIAGIGASTGHLAFKRFIGQAIVTAIALLWWQLVAYGVFVSSESESHTEPYS